MTSSDDADSFENFAKIHKGQLELSGLPQRFWPTLHKKIATGCYDAGESFCMMKKTRDFAHYCRQDVAAEQEDVAIYDWCVLVIAGDGIHVDDSQQVYLIDHFLSFQASDIDRCLAEISENEGALQRLQSIVFPGKDEDDSGLSQQDLRVRREHLWKLASYYNVRQQEESVTIWFVMDEFGSAIRHSDSPSFKVFPFLDLATGTAYSVLYPLRTIGVGDEVTRDFLDGVADPAVRHCRKLPFLFNPQLYACMHPNHRLTLPNFPVPGDFSHNPKVFDAAFFASHRASETLPNLDCLLDMPDLGTYPSQDRRIKVFSDLVFVVEFLTDKRFEIVSDKAEADIVWLYNHFKDFESFSTQTPACFVNQFPNENVLTVKDLLASLCMEAGVDWYPKTFNLEHELDSFCNFVGQRLANGEQDEFYWIVKPWNLGRGMEIFLSDSKLGLVELLRRTQALPYIASRYVHRPLLFYRDDLAASVKFDVRYLLLLRSVRPLSVYAYRVFWLRFANKEFNLAPENLHDYATHFTVMNYKDDQELKNIKCAEFVSLFDSQYGENLTWAQVEEKIILPMLRDTVQVVTRHPPPKGIAHNPQSRAIYAVDLVLGWKSAGAARSRSVEHLQAQMCEANFCPDLHRACQYTPTFMNDVFATLFLDEPSNCHTLIEEQAKFELK